MSGGSTEQDGCTIDFHAPNITVTGTIKSGAMSELILQAESETNMNENIIYFVRRSFYMETI